MSSTQNPPSAPRRRVVVSTHNALSPAEASLVRQKVADETVGRAHPPQVRASINPSSSEIPRFSPDEVQGNAPPRRDPRLPKTSWQKPPPPGQATDMDDVAAAFARAGQPVRFNNRGGANPPPAAPVEEQLDRVVLNQPRVTEPISDHSLAFREALPSNGVFYHSTVELRPFEVPEYARLYRAREDNDDTLLIDVLASVCGVDVRDLTLKDLRFLMYQLRLNSSLKSPYKLSYSSMYGNRCEFTVSTTNLKLKILEATPDEYQAWVQQGLTMPTVRDYEEYNQLKKHLGREGEFLWSKAKYVQGDNVEDKIRHLQAMPPDFMFNEIEQFARKFEDYGVIESVDLLDNKFDPQIALNKLHHDVINIDNTLENRSIALALAETLLEQRSRAQEEIARIEQQLQTSGEAAPLRETISFSIEIADFFPSI